MAVQAPELAGNAGRLTTLSLGLALGATAAPQLVSLPHRVVSRLRWRRNLRAWDICIDRTGGVRRRARG